MVRFNKVEPEKEFTEANRLGLGRHLTQVSKIIDTKKDGEEMIDKNGNPFWLVIFKDKEESEHAETFFWAGSMAWKTARMLTAIGELEEDEDIETCEKEFKKEDVLGAYLYINIEEDKNAKEEKYKYRIAKDGFEPYETEAKPAPKAPKKTQAAPF